MSLQSLTSGHTVTLQRPTTSQDSSGAPVREPWQNVAGMVDLPADIQRVSGQTRLLYQQRSIEVDFEIYLTTDVGAKAGYRFIDSAGYKYTVVDYDDEAGRGRLWVAICKRFLK